MADLNCCLSQVLHLCIETNLFLNQLYKFEYEFSRFYSSSHHPSETFFSILRNFSSIINDFNIYYENDFLKFYSNTFKDLSRNHFTINSFKDLKEFFHHQKIYYYKNLHKLNINCLLCMQYCQVCTTLELADRFVYIRSDLLIDLKELNEQIRCLIIEMNQNFEEKKQALIRNSNYSKEKNRLFWLIILFGIGCYFLWPIVYESRPKKGWPM